MASAASPTNRPPSQESIDNKILADLAVVDEKLDLCASMMQSNAGAPDLSVRDEAFQQVVGFLEACAPRMIELIEAATQGALGEAALMKCLESNDRLTQCLNTIDTRALTESPASTTVAAAAPPTSGIEDLLLSDEVQAKPVGKSTGDEEEIDFFAADAATNAAPPAVAQTKSDDEFDAFFNDRTQS